MNEPNKPVPPPQTQKRRGLLIVNTGMGKGKTTAALGTLARAWGRGMPVCVFQFLKVSTGNWGEVRALRKMGIPVTTRGAGFTWLSKDLNQDRALAVSCWEAASEEILHGSAEVILLDEFTYPLHYEWIPIDGVLEVLRRRPADRHVIITGRNAPPELIEAADLVTEMTKIKHPYDAGIGAQPGIEF